jgi:phospholipase C
LAGVNTQLFGVIDPPGNRGVLAEQMTAPFNAPGPHAVPAMGGFVADYISAFTAEMGRQPTYEEYAQIMTGYTPEQVPVISAIARGFATFDHWHCDVAVADLHQPVVLSRRQRLGAGGQRPV